MLVISQDDTRFSLSYMTEDDLCSLRKLIQSGGLEESRKWYGIKKEIDELLRDK